MADEKIPVTIVEELPTGYLVRVGEKISTSFIPKKVFIRRIEAGIYEVSNRQFLTRMI